MASKWQFWIDRGGTFTDVVMRRPDGTLALRKLLSENPEAYNDAATHAVRSALGLAPSDPLPPGVAAIRMGTTVATNALLERTGERTLLLTNEGFEDGFLIGQQHRDDLFALKPTRPTPLYDRVIGVKGRLDAAGREISPLDTEAAARALQTAYRNGYRAVAIALIHSHMNGAHERALAETARAAGFTQVSASHEVSPTVRLVPRGDTTIADAYLSPVLRRYVDQIEQATSGAPLAFMQSSGGLVPATRFQGRDAILSGPAGGMVAAARLGESEQTPRLITFDMGGTSTDVGLYNQALERVTDTVVAGTRLTVPMIDIHTVAAGGGSICDFVAGQLRVGPASAGAHPGPAAYGRGGPLTVTDCNLILGKLQAAHFPHVFGPNSDQPLDLKAARAALGQLYAKMAAEGAAPASEDALAAGLIQLAVEHMARAIRRISVGRGHDARDYSLFTFGGAGGQHACLVADALNMNNVLIPPYAGLLSALGMGLADHRTVRDRAVEAPLADRSAIDAAFNKAATDAVKAIETPESTKPPLLLRRLKVRFPGSDTLITVPDGTLEDAAHAAEAAYNRLFGFKPKDSALVVEAVEVEAVRDGASALPARPFPAAAATVIDTYDTLMDGTRTATPLYYRDSMAQGQILAGPALILEDGATTVVEPGWKAVRTSEGSLRLTRATPRAKTTEDTAADPIRLAVFNNLFMAIAEEMGSVLAATAMSVNMKERLDYSCAIFDHAGRLIANAPHMPVHLGSMGASVEAVIEASKDDIARGDGFIINDPLKGGTHLPDVTTVSPWFADGDQSPRFYVASRGHHADIGGITPGSMPAFSTSLEEEGVHFSPERVVANNKLDEDRLQARLQGARHPARNPAQNIADIRAQFAANARGSLRLQGLVDHHGVDVVEAYMSHVQRNAATAVESLIERLEDGTATGHLDNGAIIKAGIRIDKATRRAIIDFSGTSAATPDNFNAPTAVARAAVLYAFRLMTGEDIPLNHGCLMPLDIIIPEGCLLAPPAGAAVVAGNVETSQVVVNTLLRAAGAMAASQGTMNNLTFGNANLQYYETLAGGSGAGPDFDGTSAIQCHMTNSRLTDVEILEQRYPVRVTEFAVRRGSAGDGNKRGGDSLIREILFLESMDISLLSNDRRSGPSGLNGGGNGAPGEDWLIRRDGSRLRLRASDSLTAQAGERIRILTPGGGGFGPLT